MRMNKKAQVAKTINWVIASVVIIVILVVSVVATRIIGGREYTRDDFIKESDLFAAKSLTGFLLTKEKTEGYEGNIFDKLKKDGGFDKINIELSKKIFKGLYSKDYDVVNLAIAGKGIDLKKERYYEPVMSYESEERIDFNKDLHITLYFHYKK